MSEFEKLRRTKRCGELTKNDIGKEVILKGWVYRWRDHGGCVFIDLRDRTGYCQIVFNPDISPEAQSIAHELRAEYVIGVKGKVQERPEGTINPNIPTGEIEVYVDKCEILNTSQTPPFKLDDIIPINEETRLKYRYIDLRRPAMQHIMKMRYKLTKAVRDYFDEVGFYEIETPILCKSTPEGARDYLVPSRVNPGRFYALPQSPQLFKQLLMVAGYDRYFQIARCFRDEDLRADRQPEFTQIDIECSFVNQDELFEIMEGMVKHIYKVIKNIDIKTPFPRLSYKEAMLRYGSDKPDLRFGMEIVELTDVLKDSDFQIFKNTIEKGGVIRGITVKGGAKFSRKEIDDYTKYVYIFKAKGLVSFKITEEGIQSPAVKFLPDEMQKKLIKKAGAEIGDIIFVIADQEKIASVSLGALRLKLGKDLKLIDENRIELMWIVDFPMFERNEEEKRWEAMHHPFTSPNTEDLEFLEKDPGKVRAYAYDLVLNGVEIAGGSIRNHRSDNQKRVFNIIGLTEEEARYKFGFLIEALSYGAPPHGGIAFGLDRLVMELSGIDSIREVVPFPKTQTASDIMCDAPSIVDEKQLEELHIKVIEEEKE